MENLRIDENSRWTLGGVANDGSGDIKNARVNPITGALIVEATVTSTNTQIGSTIPGGTAGSVLFLGLGGTLAQDNANFFYDDTNNYLGLGTTTPSATLDVQGTAIITGSAGTPTFVLGRDGSGNVSNIVLGSNLTLTGGVLNATTSGSGYNQIQDNGTNITQRTTLNFVDYFTVTDGSSKTNVSINTAELGADTTLISTLETNMDLANISGQIDLSTQVTGTLSSTNIDITNLESNLDLANIAGQIDLTTQVSGALSLSNGGTGQALTDPNYNAVYVWDNTTNTTRLAQLSGLLYNSGTNTLTSTGSSGIALNTVLPVFSVAKIASDDSYIYNDISSGSGLIITRYKITNGGLRPYNDNGASTYWLSSAVYNRAGTGITAFTTLGGYIYIWAQKISTGIYYLLQIDTVTKAIVEMIVSGTAPAQATSSVTTDGTYIYISTYNTTTINVYSVSGTTITFISTLPPTVDVVYNIGSNFSSLFTVESSGGSTYIVREYTLSGTLINTETIGSSASIQGFFMQNGNFQYYGSNTSGVGIIINSYQ